MKWLLRLLAGDPIRTALIIAIVLCVLAIAGNVVRLHAVQATLATERLARANERAAAAQALAMEQAKNREIETQWRARHDAALEALDASKSENARLAAAVLAAQRSTVGLREQLAAFARGGDPAADSAGACQARAAALAESTSRCVGLLEEGRFLLRVVAKERDDFAAEVTACVSAWPQ